MSFVKQMQADQQIKKYEKIVHDYVETGGRMFICTGDYSFYKIVRFALERAGIDPRNCCGEVSEYSKVVALAEKFARKSKQTLVVFLERQIGKQSFVKTLKVLKKFYGDKIKVIVTSDEIPREEIILIHEVGADNVIVKPISAKSLIEKIAFSIRPDNKLQVLIKRSRQLMEEGNLEDAEGIAAKIIEAKPGSVAGFLLMGDIHKEREDFDKAKEMYMSAARSEDLFIDPLHKLVELAEDTGDVDAKLDYLNRLDKLSPLNYERKIDIGETLLDQDRMDEANEYFADARRVVKKVAKEMVSDTLMRVAKKLSQKDEAMAIKYMNEAIEMRGSDLTKDDLWMFNDRGILLRQRGEWEEAIRNYQNALRIVPNDAGIYYNIGVAFYVGKQYEKASEVFAKAMETDPDLLSQAASIPYNIAMNYIKCEMMGKAREMLEKALEVEPDFSKARDLLQRIN